MQTTATYDSAAGTFTIVKDRWQGTFPISDLPSWLDFYRQQRERYPGQFYDSDVQVLEALAAELRRSTV
ncbi:hypothetical protein [Mesorhizobium sp. B1-1-8]|uniref:hypothetical protein n=1 Tax=Mesorhizobium sp. B1-1-8 TaxID=2589976 RepID=UPI00112930FA|nr:hypothetical protein [Mesorhizobium sp. B1-1-8]UCI05167.1 hypothetical protein FJ974_14965 [Mesorhizobium sp. B1-1-8]